MIFSSKLFKPVVALAVLALVACGSSPKPTPQSLGEVKVDQPVELRWKQWVSGDTRLSQTLSIVQDRLALASEDGRVSIVNTRHGETDWRVDLRTSLNTGAGFDGNFAAVVTAGNELVVMHKGAVAWRSRLTAQSFTNPLVAGERVFVMLADRSVMAFDQTNGQRLWTQVRPSEGLVLHQNGVLTFFQNNLLVGLGGKLSAMDPDNGLLRWELPIATPRGINDLERLVDLVASASRVNNSVCVRAFQAQVGCVDALRGALLWTRPANGAQGVDGDKNTLVGTESNGVVRAWNRSTGERIWDTERLKYRELTTPLWTNKGIVVGDAGGWLYILSTQDGQLLNKIKTGSDGFASPPTALADGGFVVLTQNGSLLAYQLP
ncbi:MAG: outer membrane protein assembly factor BamB [Betaproteobacteria bacterium]|nr:outer membrane protein assembly factor BamB [Betaproteobacteria bacterium]